MNSDWYIDRGYSHKICEDYATVGDGFVIISDGCSSSEHTDIGARLLCMSAKELLNDRGMCSDYRSLKGYVVAKSVPLLDRIGLSVASLDATLLVAFVRDGFIRVYVYGDGYVVITYKTQCCKERYVDKQFCKFEYPQNAPYYPSYEADISRNIMYHKEIQTVRDSRRFVEDGFSSEEWNGSESLIDDECVITEKLENVANVVLMSDGAGSFLEKKNGVAEAVPDIDILMTFTDFKITKGEFVARRANAVMKRFRKNNITHYDDLVVGGLNFD